ncbi:uncharacterized protein I206_107590 [Kwoniella pini CBS 10737]|uniref:CD2 antigen cytoplasmic tail-binding protein 2 n=1 Tax=Kwoniella pini CBS 10737 TaxID=1296096 RepID=A0A1B9HXQ7_9TREE|nr:CD2 antigen cytoplasmic tail-binding protein 2 [Kwoniella pini CBS 10737]OCF48056.1 CD2 antigen cytoplasmic tail-binding protein 2 [Kwoniella pini CBS 10737]
MPVKRSAGSSSTAPKRTRFATSPSANSPSGSNSANDDDYDGMLENDLQQGAARNKQRAKRSLQDKEGYGSDSSNDDEGVVPSRRPDSKSQQQEEEDDDDVDMFAEDVDIKEKEKEKDLKGKGKSKDFLDLNEIEGQEFDQQQRSKKNQDENDSDDSDDEDEKVEKKQGLDGDMGTEITPFNMKSEMTQGRFTADGEEYMENDKDENDKHDSWLNDPNLNKESIKKAKKAHKERERLERELEEKENSKENRLKERELLKEAINLMERGETILEALQRLGKFVEKEKLKNEQGKKKLSWAEKQKERKKIMATEQEQADPIHTPNPFTNLSNIVSQLTTSGQIDVYSLSKESIQRMLPAESANTNGSSQRPAAPPMPVIPTDTRQFQYRFSMAYVRNLPEAQRPVEREVFGPFPAQQLKQWRNTGFFGGPACENVELRLMGTENQNGPWGSWADIVGQ